MPEIEIQNLLDTIKQDGIDKAEDEYRKITNQALEDAKSIVLSAKNEADEIKKTAKEEIETFRKQAVVMLKQAENNVCLEMKKRLENMISAVVKKELSAQMLSDKVCEFVKEAIKDKNPRDYILKVSDEVVEAVRSKLVDEIYGSLQIEGLGGRQTGFKLVMKDGSGYYDFTTQELMEMLSGYLSESVNKVLKDK